MYQIGTTLTQFILEEQRKHAGATGEFSCVLNDIALACKKIAALTSKGDLIGVLNQFFSRLGLKKLRFKPAFNPYTEPSMEIFR
jgi:phenylalanyl-tRNA synthetase alpha subunit